jgi:hypothetical protein
MKLIIAGSRTIENIDISRFVDNIAYEHIPDNQNNPRELEIVSGGARGIDYLAKCLAQYYQTQSFRTVYKVSYTEFPANWDKHGKAAGPIRNIAMAEYGDTLLLIWDGESRGSKNMKETMLELGKPIYEVILRSYNVPEET